MTFDEAISGSEAPKELIADMRLVPVQYIGFDSLNHQGQIVVHRELAEEVQEIFSHLKEHQFPIEKVIPTVVYNWDDIASMEDNNSSAFNYRLVAGTDRPSNHSYGRAIDINPKLNPYIGTDGVATPTGSSYDPQAAGTITDGGIVVKIFSEYGWEWGGYWQETRGYVDYHHFQKTT